MEGGGLQSEDRWRRAGAAGVMWPRRCGPMEWIIPKRTALDAPLVRGVAVEEVEGGGW